MPHAYSDKQGNQCLTFNSPAEFFHVLHGTVYDAHVIARRQRKWLDRKNKEFDARSEAVGQATQEIIARKE